MSERERKREKMACARGGDIDREDGASVEELGVRERDEFVRMREKEREIMGKTAWPLGHPESGHGLGLPRPGRGLVLPRPGPGLGSLGPGAAKPGIPLGPGLELSPGPPGSPKRAVLSVHANPAKLVGPTRLADLSRLTGL